MSMPASLYRLYRFPAEIIGHYVWPSFRFCLSDRDTEERMMTRGVFVTYETIRQWCQKFGRPLPTTYYAGADRGRGTNGTSTKCFSRLMAIGSTCGGPSIKRGWSWTSWCSHAGI